MKVIPKEAMQDIDFHIMIRKDHRNLILILLGSAICNVLLILLLTFQMNPKLILLRLDDDPDSNQTIVINDHYDAKNKIQKKDLLNLVNFVVEHYDLKSRSDALKNFEKLQSVSEDTFLSQLDQIKNEVISNHQNSIMTHVYNSPIDSEILNTAGNMIVIKSSFSQVVVKVDGTTSSSEKNVTMTFKKVDRKKYKQKQQLGGWYYGLMLVSISDDIHRI